MSISTISLSDLNNVNGGQQPPANPPPGLAQGVGQVAKKAVPILKAIDIGDGAVTDYNRARANGDGRLDAVGSGLLGGLNRGTFGLSNWILGRK